MLRSAIPCYLGNDFNAASLGLRFGMCLKLWDANEWSCVGNKTKVLRKEAAHLNPCDKEAMEALATRQRLLAQARSEETLCTFLAKSVAPFTTGLGNEHPLENGFSFLNPYGLPYLPGSGVKGVVRQAAFELAGGKWGDTKGWCKDMIDVLFGYDSSNTRCRGALAFWDVVPQIEDKSLAVEIMTPHQTEYYKGNQSPHDSGSPIPIPFLTVPPGSSFAFHVACDHRLLRMAQDQDLAESGRWKVLLGSAFEHAFEWLGFGAKTAVGYGAMRLASQAEAIRCEWVEEKIKKLASENHSSEQEMLRGRALANAWSQIEDTALKKRARADIKARWEQQGWWDNPPGKAAKAARRTYAEES